MTNMELLLNALAEETATELSKQRNPEGLSENAGVAKEGAEVAKTARKEVKRLLTTSSLRKNSHFLMSRNRDSKKTGVVMSVRRCWPAFLVGFFREVILAPHFITSQADYGDIHRKTAVDVTVEASRITSPIKNKIKMRD